MYIIHEQMNKILHLDPEQMRTSRKPNLQLDCREVIRKESLKRRSLGYQGEKRRPEKKKKNNNKIIYVSDIDWLPSCDELG